MGTLTITTPQLQAIVDDVANKVEMTEIIARSIFYDPKDFGAVCNGLTDDSAAINAAIAAGSVDFGGVDRTYLVNDNTLNIISNRYYKASGATIKSTVHNSVHTVYSRPIFRNSNHHTSNSTVENVVFSGLVFRTNISTTASKTGFITIAEAATIKNILIEHCDFSNANCDGNGISIGGGAQVTTTPHCENITIRDNIINPGRAGVEVLNQSGPGLTNDQVIKASMVNVQVYRNRITNAGQYANTVYSGLGISYSGPVDALRCYDNEISGSWYAGIELTFGSDGNTEAEALDYFVDNNHVFDNHRNIVVNVGSSVSNWANTRVRGIRIRNNKFANPWFKDLFLNLGEGCEITGNEFRVNVFRDAFTDGAGGTSAGNKLHPVDFVSCDNIKVKDNSFFTEASGMTHYAFCPRFFNVSDSDIEDNRFYARGSLTAVEFGYTSELVTGYFKTNRVRGNKFRMGSNAERVIMLSGNDSNNNYGADNVLYAVNVPSMLIDERVNAGAPVHVNNDIPIATYSSSTGIWSKPSLSVRNATGAVSDWQTIPGTYTKILQIDNGATTFTTVRFTLKKLAIGNSAQYPGNTTAGTTGAGQIPALFEVFYGWVYNNKPIGGSVRLSFGTSDDPTRKPLLSYSGTGNREIISKSLSVDNLVTLAASGSATTSALTLPPTRNGRVDGRGDVVVTLALQLSQHSTAYNVRVQIEYSINSGSTWLIAPVCQLAANTRYSEFNCPGSSNGNFVDLTVIRRVQKSILSTSGDVQFRAIVTSLDATNAHDLYWTIDAKESVSSDYSDGTPAGETVCTPTVLPYGTDGNGDRYFDLVLPTPGVRQARIQADIKPVHYNAYSVSII